jgi:hypothetical protein
MTPVPMKMWAVGEGKPSPDAHVTVLRCAWCSKGRASDTSTALVKHASNVFRCAVCKIDSSGEVKRASCSKPRAIYSMVRRCIRSQPCNMLCASGHKERASNRQQCMLYDAGLGSAFAQRCWAGFVRSAHPGQSTSKPQRRFGPLLK